MRTNFLPVFLILIVANSLPAQLLSMQSAARAARGTGMRQASSNAARATRVTRAQRQPMQVNMNDNIATVVRQAKREALVGASAPVKEMAQPSPQEEKLQQALAEYMQSLKAGIDIRQPENGKTNGDGGGDGGPEEKDKPGEEKRAPSSESSETVNRYSWLAEVVEGIGKAVIEDEMKNKMRSKSDE